MSEIRRKIVDPDSNDQILRMIGSKHARKIIEITNQRSMSAMEISKTADIPLTKVYRWLQKLENHKLLHVTGTINSQRRKVRLYKSLVEMIMIHPGKNNSPRIEILGSGETIFCSKCGSSNCTLEYDKNFNKTVCKCIDCEIRYLQVYSHTLREEKQKVIILKGLSYNHQLAEEHQKVIILKGLLDLSTNKPT